MGKIEEAIKFITERGKKEVQQPFEIRELDAAILGSHSSTRNEIGDWKNQSQHSWAILVLFNQLECQDKGMLLKKKPKKQLLSTS